MGFILNPGSRIVLGNNTATNDWFLRYPGVSVSGWFDGSLNNGGERLAIYDEQGNRVLSVDYSDGGSWPPEADGLGYSLQIIDPNGDPDDPANWRASTSINGTPGLPASQPAPPTVVLNEIMAENVAAVAHGTNYPDYVELRNTSSDPVDLSGWSLTDSGDPRKFVFPSGTSIDGNSYLVIWCDNTQPPSTVAGADLNTGFALSHLGESIFLYGATTNRVDGLTYGIQIPDYSVGRISSKWVLNQPTAGAGNQAAVVTGTANLAINEWLADAPPGGSDWIELYNAHASLPVALQGIYLGTSNALFQVRSLSFVAPRGYVQLFADGNPGQDHLDFNLPKEGGAIVLYDATGLELSRVVYGSQLENVTQGRLPNGSSTIVEFPVSPSPAASNFAATYTGPHLNEIMARNQSASVGPYGQYADWIELENPNSTAVDLSGMRLSDSPSNPVKWIFPAGTSIEASGYLVIWCDGSQPGSTTAGGALNTGFALGGASGGVYLFNSLGQRVDAVEYGFQLPDRSLGLANGQWSLSASPTPGQFNTGPATLGNVSNLRLNEWMPASTNGPDWFEIYNTDSLPVNMAGIYLTDDPSLVGIGKFQVPPLSFIGGKAWVQWIADGSAGQGRDHVNFALDADAGTIQVYSSTFALLQTVSYGNKQPDVSQGRLPDGANTIVDFDATASPGAANYLPLTNVVINEVLAHTDPPREDAIELYNPSGTTVAVGGWYLSTSEKDLKRFRIPAGTSLAAGDYLVFYENQFNPNPGVPPSFALSSSRGDTLYLSATDGGDNLTGYRTSVSFGASQNGVSLGSIPTSVGTDFGALVETTFGADDAVSVEQFRSGTGAPNAAPRVGPIVINEIMYHPNSLVGGQATEIQDEEYIELLNISSSAVTLFDGVHTTNRWQLEDAVSFVFPPGASLEAGEYCLVVNFDPVLEPLALLSFRAKYGLGSTVQVFGPWSGRLDNAGENVALYQPDPPQTGMGADAGFVPYVLEDRVHYSDQDPWPTNGVDGLGASLQRIAAADYGNDPANWKGQAPTPGAENVEGALVSPTLDAAPQSQTVIAGQLVTFSVSASGTPPLRFQWLFDSTPISGATDASYTIPAAQPANEGSYSVVVTNNGGSIVSPAATLTVLEPPHIDTVLPADQTIAVGGNATITATVTGTAPLHFQWYLGDLELSGAEASSLTINNADFGDGGDYWLIVTNLAGAATSQVARVVVKSPPAITGHPQSLTVTEGNDATFNVSVTGDPPLTFVWYANGAVISGANGSSLSVSTVTTNDNGNLYWVVISNDVGSVMSSQATLSVLGKPVLANLQRLPDGSLSFAIDGPDSHTYWLESSTNLLNWDNVSEQSFAAGDTVIVNTGTNGVQRFYRARMEP